jgi:hypothetical protein
MAKADFPSNSFSGDPRIDEIQKLKTEPSVEEGKTEKPAEEEVFEGRVAFKRKTFGERLKTMFFTDGKSFVEHLVENVVIPMGKDIILSVIVQVGDNTKRGFEQMLFPNGSSVNDVRTSRPSGPISYNNIHRSSTVIRRSSVTPEYHRPQSRHSNMLEDLAFEYRSDAQKLVLHLQDLIEELGHCSVGDLYEYVDPDKIQPTDEAWGWAGNDMDRVYIRQDRGGGVLLTLPDPRPIKQRNR